MAKEPELLTYTGFCHPTKTWLPSNSLSSFLEIPCPDLYIEMEPTQTKPKKKLADGKYLQVRDATILRQSPLSYALNLSQGSSSLLLV